MTQLRASEEHGDALAELDVECATDPLRLDTRIPFRVLGADDFAAMAASSDRASPQDVSRAMRRRMPGLLHVVVRACPGGFTAHCVEFGCIGEGDSEQEAIDSVFGLLRGYVLSAIELDEVEHLIPPPAPPRDPLTLKRTRSDASDPPQALRRRQAPRTPEPPRAFRSAQTARRRSRELGAPVPRWRHEMHPRASRSHTTRERDARLDHPTQRDSRG